MLCLYFLLLVLDIFVCVGLWHFCVLCWYLTFYYGWYWSLAFLCLCGIGPLHCFVYVVMVLDIFLLCVMFVYSVTAGTWHFCMCWSLEFSYVVLVFGIFSMDGIGRWHFCVSGIGPLHFLCMWYWSSAFFCLCVHPTLILPNSNTNPDPDPDPDPDPN